MCRSQVTHIRVVLAAAGRLALVYAMAVVTLVAALFLWTQEWHGALVSVLTFEARLMCTLSAALFILLALFRRLGVALAWVALCVIWIAGPLRWIPVGILAGFVHWSILAIPLYLMWLIGYRDWTAARGASFITPATCLLAAWLGLLAFTLAIVPAAHLFVISAIDGVFDEPSAAILRRARLAWAPVPFVIATQAIADVLAEPVRCLLRRFD